MGDFELGSPLPVFEFGKSIRSPAFDSVVQNVVTPATNGHQISRIVRSTVSSPDNVMDFQNIIRMLPTPITKPTPKVITFQYLVPKLFTEPCHIRPPFKNCGQ